MVRQAEIDALHSTPPADFVAARNELAKRARAAKQDALAREIAALRKPHAVVWLINQLARRHPADVASLVEAGEGLRQAQRAVVRGGGGAPLRDANRDWRSAVSRALKDIRAIAGHAIEEPRIVATLLAAATDPDHAKRLQGGRLTGELEPPGIESALGALGEARPERRRSQPLAAKSKATHEQEQRARRQSEREAAAALRERERRAAQARKAAERAERDAARLERRTAEAAERAAQARAAADAARRRAAALDSEK